MAAQKALATEKQVAFIEKLAEQKENGWTHIKDQMKSSQSLTEISKSEASHIISVLLHEPNKGAAAVAELVAGIYLVDGKVVKVQKSKTSGKPYAMELIVSGKSGSFIYRPGLIYKVQPEDKMSLASAVEFGMVYGVCCNCGRTLTNKDSVEAGIGPICAKKFG